MKVFSKLLYLGIQNQIRLILLVVEFVRHFLAQNKLGQVEEKGGEGGMGEAGGGLSWLILWGQLVLFHRGGTILAAVVVCEHKCSLRPGCKAAFTPGWVEGQALPGVN